MRCLYSSTPFLIDMPLVLLRKQEGTEHAQSLSSISSYLVDMYRPVKPSINGYPKISCRLTCIWISLLAKKCTVCVPTYVVWQRWFAGQKSVANTAEKWDILVPVLLR